MSNDIMTKCEAAIFVRLTEQTSYRYVLEGHLPGSKVGGTCVFRRDNIEKLTKGEPVQKIKKSS